LAPHPPPFPTRRSSDLLSAWWHTRGNRLARTYFSTRKPSLMPTCQSATWPSSLRCPRISVTSNQSRLRTVWLADCRALFTAASRSEEHTSELQSRENLV